MEFFYQPLLEQRLRTLTAGVVGLSLVVQLESNDMVVLLHFLHQAANDPFAVEAVAGMGDVHILPMTVLR